MLIAFFVIMFDSALTASLQSVDNPDYPAPETPNPEPIVPKDPISRIVFVSDIPAGSTQTFEFSNNTLVYVASTSDNDDYENQIHFHLPNEQGTVRMTDAKRQVNEEGVLNPVFGVGRNQIQITNKNEQDSQSKKPGIIYFVASNDGNRVNKVYDTSNKRLQIFTESDNLNEHYVTLLNSYGAVKVSKFRNIKALGQLTVSAGGVEEAQNTDYTIYNIGADAANTNAAVVIPEPVVTVRKQLSLIPGNFEFTANGVEITKELNVNMNWSDWTVAMSPNYKLRNVSDSFKYVFNASLENSQYEVQILGTVDQSSSLKFTYDGYDGEGMIGVRKGEIEREAKYIKGQKMTVEYNRGSQDKTSGVLVRVVCKQPASVTLFYITLITMVVKYLLLQ